MNRSFKVVGRYKAKDEQPPWMCGKPGCVAKKRVYTSLKDFENYSPELISRYRDLCNYDVEVYELIDEKWSAHDL